MPRIWLLKSIERIGKLQRVDRLFQGRELVATDAGPDLWLLEMLRGARPIKISRIYFVATWRATCVGVVRS